VRYEKQTGLRKLGIMILDRRYRLVPGNAGRQSTYDFPVEIRKIEGLFNPPSPPVRNELGELSEDAKKFLLTAQELERSGVSAIMSSCGFFSLMQCEANSAVKIPVYTSPLMLIPIVQTLIPTEARIGLLTLFKEYLTHQYFRGIYGIDMDRIVFSDMSKAHEFRRMINQDSPSVNEGELKYEVIKAALDLAQKGNDIEAIVVECSDMTPYSEEIRRLTKLPVYDYRTLGQIAYNSSIISNEVE